MIDSYTELRKIVSAIQPLSEIEWNAFSSIWIEYSAKRKEQLTVIGEREKYLYFVIKAAEMDAHKIVAEFIQQQEQLLSYVKQARQTDLNKIRLPISILKWIMQIGNLIPKLQSKLIVN